MRRPSFFVLAWALLLLVSSAHPGRALFHLAVIDELMTSYGEDPDVQFVEIKMLFAGQNLVTNSVLSVFDESGSFVGDVLIVPGNVENSGNGVTWIMGTAQFQAVSGLAPDFIFDPVTLGLPVNGGMVCWGAPDLTFLPPADTGWDRLDFDNNWVDCVAYGDYSGPTNSLIGNSTPLVPVGHSLERIFQTSDNATDFACADPASPTNNAGNSGPLPATVLCPEPGATLLCVVALGVVAALRRSRR